MKTINKIIVLALSIITFSCEDIIEEDIANDIVQIISPLDNTIIESNVVTFQWNSLKGADKYRVQVYAANQSIVIDTLVSKTTVTPPIEPGNYKWRVRGENSAYESTYSFPVNFSVIETENLNNQQLVLVSPTTNFFTNATSITCSWQNINVANYYEFELVNLTNGQTIVYQQSNIETTSVTLNNTILSQEASYEWKVKAVNETSQTTFATRKFSIDRVAPNAPQNSLPATNSTQLINQPISFSWTSPSDTGSIQSPISYTIEFSNNVNFETIIQTSNSSTTTFQQTFTSTGTYYWRVKAIDAAANNSTYSTGFKFII